MGMVAFWQGLAHEEEIAEQRLHWSAMWIDETWQDCLQRGIAKDQPDDLREYAAKVQWLVDERNRHTTEKMRYLALAEALQESLTFYLSREYGIDPLKEQWQIDIDHCVLIHISTGKEGELDGGNKGGSDVTEQSGP